MRRLAGIMAFALIFSSGCNQLTPEEKAIAFAEAKGRFQSGDFSGAAQLEKISASLLDNSDLDEYYQILTYSNFKTGNFETAWKHAGKLAGSKTLSDAHRKSSYILFARIALAKNRGGIAAALNDLRKIAPENPEWLSCNGLMSVLFEQNKFAEISELYKSLENLADPQSIAVLKMFQSLVLMRGQQYREANQLLLELKKSPNQVIDSEQIDYSLGFALMQQQKYSEAAKIYSGLAASKAEKIAIKSLLLNAYCNKKTGNLKAAGQSFMEVIRRCGDKTEFKSVKAEARQQLLNLMKK